MSTCIAIIDSKTVGTPATQPHTHTDTDGMMSDPTRAVTHHVLQPTSRAKMTCPNRCAPPTPAPDSSRSVYREMPDTRMEGKRRCRRHAIPAQKKSTGTQGLHRHQLGLNGMATHGETRRQRGGHRKSSRTPVKPRPTDQTPGTEDSPPTGPDVSHLSESNPIPRRGEPSAQGPRSLKRDQTWWTPRPAATPAQPASPTDHCQRITEAK